MQFSMNILYILQKGGKKRKKEDRIACDPVFEKMIFNYASSAKYLMVRTIWLV